MTKVSDFRELDVGGLQGKIKEMEAEFFDLKFQLSLSKLENVSLIKQKRRDIARARTVLNQKQKKEKVSQ